MSREHLKYVGGSTHVMCKHCAIIACKRSETPMSLVSMQSPRTTWILEGVMTIIS